MIRNELTVSPTSSSHEYLTVSGTWGLRLVATGGANGHECGRYSHGLSWGSPEKSGIEIYIAKGIAEGIQMNRRIPPMADTFYGPDGEVTGYCGTKTALQFILNQEA